MKGGTKMGVLKKVWNDIRFWRLQFFVQLVIIAILTVALFYLLDEYEHVANELIKCMQIGK